MPFRLPERKCFLPEKHLSPASRVWQTWRWPDSGRKRDPSNPMPAAAPSYFNILTGGDHSPEEAPAQAAWLIEQLALAVEIYPVWRISGGSYDGSLIRLAVAERSDRKFRVRLLCGRWEGELLLRIDGLGWVCAEVVADGKTVLAALGDRPYEEIEWHAQFDRSNGPAALTGSMGKRITWISLPVSQWPVLADVADGIWFNAEAVEGDLVPPSP